MNSSEKRYLFITPYLSEVERIKNACRSRRFVAPEPSMRNNFSKTNGIKLLIEKRRNIVSTHALFKHFNDEIKEELIQGEYVLILDETLDVYEQETSCPCDLDILVQAGILKPERGRYKWYGEYKGVLYKDIYNKLKSQELYSNEEEYFWGLNTDIFSCFTDVYILTYLYEYQLLSYQLETDGFGYEMLGVRKNGEKYEFCAAEEMDRRVDLRDKIHIYEGKKNEIGEAWTNLSATWYAKENIQEGKPRLKGLKNDLGGLLRNEYKARASEILWTTLSPYKDLLKGQGYTKSFLAFNTRACNDYRERKYLAFTVNVYMPTWAKFCLRSKGNSRIMKNENMYAVSVLIQWIFRSAVRKGEDVWLYLPSRRMREVFKIWLERLAAGRDLQGINLVDASTKTKEAQEIQKSKKALTTGVGRLKEKEKQR